MDEVDLANDQVQADINATFRAARKDMKKGQLWFVTLQFTCAFKSIV